MPAKLKDRAHGALLHQHHWHQHHWFTIELEMELLRLTALARSLINLHS